MTSNALTKQNKSELVESVTGLAPVLTFDWTPGTVGSVSETELIDRAHGIRDTSDNMSGMLTVFSAQTVYAAKFTHDLIGKDKKYPTEKEFAAEMGVSGSQVTRLARLGRAVEIHNVPVTFEPRGSKTPSLWQKLTRIVNDAPAVRDLLKEDTPVNLTVLEEAVDNWIKVQSEAAAAAAAAAAANTDNSGGDSGQTKADADKSNQELFSVLHNRLAYISDNYTPESGQDFLTRAMTLVEKAQEMVAAGEAAYAEKHPEKAEKSA